jgi:ATP-dependent DNA helicase RecG
LAAPRISVLRVTERIATGISLGESHFREFKSAIDRSGDSPRWRDPKLVARDIAETLVAFANADGGELYIGIEDDGTVTGLSYHDSHFNILTEAPKTHVHSGTPLPAPTIARVNYENKTVLYFQVAKSSERVHLTADGRCLQRFDRQNRPVPAEEIQYTRREKESREYDRAFTDGANLTDLDIDLIDAISKEHAGGQSPEKFLQYMDVAEYGTEGIRLRRAALLLFAADISRWHPRCEVRIIRVSGTELGVGKDYNVLPKDDQTVRGNVLHLLQAAWDTLRPFLTQVKFVESGIFRETLVYPEEACREALINAVAHRDYSVEGKGIEILIYDDRLEVKSPGGLLSSLSLDDLRSGKRTHQSRNAYLARVLREFGYMREMGEGMLRIFATMRDRNLVPPEIQADATMFDMVLHHRSVFSPKDEEWLRAYADYGLSRDEQRVILLGRDGHKLSKNEIMDLGIVHSDQFRQLVEHLRRKGILYNSLDRNKLAGIKPKQRKQVGRFGVRPPDETERYRRELESVVSTIGPVEVFTIEIIKTIGTHLSQDSPYKENTLESLKLLGFVDESLRPLRNSTIQWKDRRTGRGTFVSSATQEEPRPQVHRIIGQVINLKRELGYGFIGIRNAPSVFFHKSALLDPRQWEELALGDPVEFEYGFSHVAGKPRPAHKIKIYKKSEQTAAG